jgi:hypothetical protein
MTTYGYYRRNATDVVATLENFFEVAWSDL